MMVNLTELPWEDVTYAHIFSNLNLRDLFNLRCVSRELCLIVDKYFTTWQSLDLSKYSCIGSDAFGVRFSVNSKQDIPLVQVLLESCNNLRYVNLRNNYWLNSTQLMLLLHKHDNLAQLDLSGCNNESMHHSTIDISTCNNLTSIRLQNCKWVTAQFLLNLTQCNNLKEVMVADCYQISDEAMISLCQYSKGLSHIAFENLTISDQTLYAVSRYCRTVKEFCLRKCSRITDAGLLSLRSLPFLMKLEVSGCVLVTERGLAPMRGRVDIDLPPKPICQPQPLSLQV